MTDRTPRPRWILPITIGCLMLLTAGRTVVPAPLPVKINPGSLKFGQQAVGTTSAAKSLSVTNTQSTPLTITGIVTTGDFLQTNNCPTSLAPKAQCTVNVVFAPIASGSRSGTVEVRHNAAGSPTIATLAGAATDPVTLAPNSLSFGPQVVGTTAAPKTTTLTNNQSTTLSIASIVSSGDFAHTHNCGTSLAAGAMCTISVTFTPTQIGPRTGSVVITHSATSSPQTLAVTGTGSSPGLSSLVITPATATVPLGTSQQFTVIGTFSNGSKQDLTASAAWSSTVPAVATVSSGTATTGLASSVSVGSTNIIATIDTITASATLTVNPPALVSLTITPVNPSVPLGSSRQLTATGTYTNNSTQDLTTSVAWSSSTPSVATVANAPGSQGLVSTVSQGTTTITATLSGIIGTTDLQVAAPALVSIAVSPIDTTVALGLAQQFSAVGTYTNGSTSDLTDAAAWSVAVPAVASISNTAGSRGLATTLSQGSTAVTATVGSIAGTTNFSVAAPALTAITVAPDPASLAVGLTQQFTATGTYTNGATQDLTATATWSAGAAGTASISNASGTQGLATGIQTGSTTITATLGGISGSASLTVGPAVLVSITVSPQVTSVPVGLTQQFTASGLYSDASTQDLTAQASWTSADTAVASVGTTTGSHGLASGLTQGTVTVTAAVGSISGTATLSVGPKALVSIDVAPASGALTIGGTQQFTATGSYTDASTADVTAIALWSSSDSAIATVSSDAGLAAGVVPGTVSITATIGAISGSASLVVTSQSGAITSLTVTPNDPAVPLRAYRQLTATVIFEDGSSLDVSAASTWQSADATTVTVSDAAGTKGLVQRVRPGVVSVTATFGAFSDSTTVSDSGGFAYVLQQWPGEITPYAIDAANGSLTAVEDSGVSTATSGGAVKGAVKVAAKKAVGQYVRSMAADPQGRFIYAVDYYSQAIQGFQIDGITGALTPMPGSPFSAGGTHYPAAAIVSPDGRFLYATDDSSPSLLAFAIDQTDGALAPLVGSPFDAGGYLSVLVVEPLGRRIYALSGNQVVGFDRDLASGALTRASWSATLANYPSGAAADPAGRFLYVWNWNQIQVFALAASTGEPVEAPESPFAVDHIVALTATPDGAFSYSAGGYNTVSGFIVDAASGDLTAVPGSPFSLSTTSYGYPVSMATDPSGRLVLVLSQYPQSVEALTIAPATGTLTSASTSSVAPNGWGYPESIVTVATRTIAAGAVLQSLEIVPSASSIITSTLGRTQQLTAIGRYSDGTSQFLTASASWNSSDPTVATVETGSDARGLATSIGYGTATITASFGGQSASATIAVVVPALTTLDIRPANLTLATGRSIQLRAEGTFTDGEVRDLTADVDWASNNASIAAVSNTDGSRGLVTTGAAGATQVSATFGAFSASTSLTVVPRPVSTARDARFAYVPLHWPYYSIAAFSIDPTTGDFTPVPDSPFQFAQGFGTLVLDPLGRFLYGVNWQGIETQTIDPSTGALTPAPAPPLRLGAGQYVQQVVADPTGKFVFASTDYPYTLRTFAVDRATGGLTEVSTLVVNQYLGAFGVGSAGDVLYAIANGDSLLALAIDGTTGALTEISGSPVPIPGSGQYLSMDPLGRFVQVVGWSEPGYQAWTFPIDETTGALNAPAALPLDGYPIYAPVPDPIGGFWYLPFYYPSTGLNAFLADAISGALTRVPGGPFGSIPNDWYSFRALAFGREDRLYSLKAYPAEIQRYAIDAATGTPVADGAPLSLSGTGATVSASDLKLSPGPLTAAGATLVSLEVVPDATTLILAQPGQTVQLAVIGTYSDGSRHFLTTSATWSSSDALIASVTSSGNRRGLATTTGYGTATVTAAVGTITDTATIAVLAPDLASLSISPADPTVQSGTVVRMIATGHYTDGTHRDVTADVSWTSLNTGVATVSSGGATAGRVTTITTGSAVISAALGGQTQSVTLTSIAPTVVTGRAARFAYVTAGYSIGGYSIDATTGALTALASGPHTVGDYLYSLKVDPKGRSLFARTSRALRVYAIDSGTGELSLATDLPTTGWATGSQSEVAIHPSGSYLYLGDAQGQVHAYALGEDGTLTPLAGSPFAATGTYDAYALAIDPQGRFLYATNPYYQRLIGFAIDAGTGALTPLPGSPYAVGQYPYGLAVDPLSRFVFVTNSYGHTLQTFSIDSATGDLGNALTGSPVSNYFSPFSLAPDPGGSFLYAPNAYYNYYYGAISGFLVDASTGGLSPLVGSPFTTNSYYYTYDFAVDPSGGFGYALGYNGNHFVNVMAIDRATGALTVTGAGSPVLSGAYRLALSADPVQDPAATLVSLEILPGNPAIITADPGRSKQLLLVGTFSDSTRRLLTASASWSTTHGTIATVSDALGSKGLLTSTGFGSTTVTATYGGQVATATVGVLLPAVATLEIAPLDPTIKRGTAIQFTATGTFTDGSRRVLTDAVTWSSANSAVATVSNSAGSHGLVTTVDGGSTSITATIGSVSASTSFTTEDPAFTLVSIAVSPTNAAVQPGHAVQYAATGTFADGSSRDVTTQVIWTSSAPLVATVSNAPNTQGLAASLAVGNTTIRAGTGAIFDTTILTVAPPVLDAIAIAPSTGAVAAGRTRQFTASGTFSDGTIRDVTGSVTWTSTNAAVATITNAAATRGLATALAAGTTTITATSGLVQSSVSFVVDPPDLLQLDVTPLNPSVPLGSVQALVATGRYSDGTTQDLTATATWTAIDGAIARLSTAPGEAGFATGLAEGTTTILASANGFVGRTDITVMPAAVVSIAVSPSTASILDGSDQAFTATATLTDGTTLDVTATARWTASDSTIAMLVTAVGSAGRFTGVSAGTVTITAAVAGVSGSATLEVRAVELIPQFAVVTSNDGLDVFTVDAQAGALQRAASSVPLAAGTPRGAYVHPSGRFVYAGNAGCCSAATGVVSGFALDPVSGVLTPVSGSPFAAGSQPSSLAGDRSGNYLYAANHGSNSLSAYRVDTTTGALSAVAGSPYALSASPSALTVDPAGQTVFVATASGMAVFRVDATSGALQEVSGSPFSGASAFADVAVSTDGSRLFAPFAGGIASFDIDPTTGSLNGISGSPVSSGVDRIAVEPGGRFLLAVDYDASQLLVYTISPAGLLSQTPASPFATGAAPRVITLDPSGRFVYVADEGGNTISAFRLDPVTGSLTAIPGSPLPAGNGPYSIAVSAVSSDPAASITGLIVTPSTTTVPLGATVQLRARATQSDGTSRFVSAGATWSSIDQSVASVTNDPNKWGQVTGQAVGSTAIAAAFGGVTTNTSVTVGPAALVSMVVTPAGLTVPLGTVQQFSAQGRYTDGSILDITGLVDWGVSTATVASVSNAAGSKGRLATLAAGTIDVIASLDGVTAAVTFTVAPAAVVSVTVAPATASIALGLGQQFTATALYTDGTSVNVTNLAAWTSSAPAVATVANGLATGVGEGPATISASFGGQSGSASLSVTAPALLTIAIAPVDPSIPLGATQQFTATGTYTNQTSVDVSASVIWGSSAAGVASVDAAGLATSASQGQTTISASSGAVSASTTLIVSAPAVVSVTVSPTDPAIELGTLTQLNATATYTNGQVVDVTTSAAWSSSDTDFVLVSNAAGQAGHAAGVRVGGAVVTATIDGVSGDTTVTVTRLTMAPRFAYSTGRTSNNVFAFTVDAVSGTLTRVNGSPFTASAPYGIAATRSGRFVFTANNNGSLSAFAADQQTGTLSPLSGSPFATASGTQAVVVDPTDRFVYVGSTSGIYGFQLDAANGSLTAIPGSPFGGPTLSWGFGIHPSGRYLFATSPTSMRGFAIDPTSGALSELASSPFTTGTQPVGVAVDPSGRFVYVANEFSSDVSGFAVDLFSGSLTPLAGSPYSINSTNNIQGARVDPLGRFLYLSSTNAGDVFAFTIDDATGTLTSVPGSPFASGGGTLGLAADPSGAFLYTANLGSNDVDGFRIDAGSGALTAVAGSPFASGTSARGVVVTGVPSADNATLVSLAIQPGAPIVQVGASLQLNAVGTYSDGSTRFLTTSSTWTSSLPGVATVGDSAGSKGLVTGIGQGTATISASYGGQTATTTVTVPAPVPVSVEVTPLDPSRPLGSTQQFTATATYANGTQADVTAAADWSSSLPSVASIGNSPGNKGLASTLSTGMTTISAVVQGVNGSSVLTVSPPAVVSIQVTPGSLTLAAEGVAQLTAVAQYSDGSQQTITSSAAWSSSDATIATVGNTSGVFGQVTGVGAGLATITASSNGVSATASVQVVAQTVVPRFAFVTTNSGLMVYAIDALTGDLTRAAGPFSMNTDGRGVAVHPSGRFVYVGSGVCCFSHTDVITGFGVDRSTGTLSNLPGSPFAAGQLPTTLVMHPSGRFLYAANRNGNSVGAFSVNQASGALSAVSGSPFAAPNSPNEVTITPDGRFVLLASDAGISIYAVDDITGALTVVSGSPFFGVASFSIVAEPLGRYVYALRSDGLASFSLNGSTGALTAIGTTISSPVSRLAVDPSGTYVMGTNFGGGTVPVYRIGATGEVTEVPGSPFTAGSLPRDVRVDPSGRFVYVANQGGHTVTAFGLDNVTGALSTLPTSPVAAQQQPFSIGVSRTYVDPLATVTGLSVVPASASSPAGVARQFVARASFSDGTTRFVTASATWSSADPAVAVVSNDPASRGSATGLVVGSVVISATYQGFTGTAVFTVTAPILTSVAVTPTNPTIVAGSTQQFTATATFSNGSTQDVTALATWTSSVPSVATVSNTGGTKGLATGVATGTTSVRASYNGFLGSTFLTVN